MLWLLAVNNEEHTDADSGAHSVQLTAHSLQLMPPQLIALRQQYRLPSIQQNNIECLAIK